MRQECSAYRLPTDTRGRASEMAKFVLRHKLPVVLVWLALSAVSIATIGRLGPRLDYTYTTPGQPGFEANLKITSNSDWMRSSSLHCCLAASARTYHGLTRGSGDGGKTFAAAYQAGPLAVADSPTPAIHVHHRPGARHVGAHQHPQPGLGAGAGIEGRMPRVLQRKQPLPDIR